MLTGTWVLYLVLALLAVAFGTIKIAFVPLALWFEWRRGILFTAAGRLSAGPPGSRSGAGPRIRPRTRLTRADRHFGPASDHEVSVIVPAYNEEKVLRACIESILTTRCSLREIIIVDDGSTDGTAELMRELADRHPQVRAVFQENSGKGAALNRGLALAVGDVFVFVDADGVFSPVTIPWLLTGFRDPRVGAVCGDDRPVNLDRVLTRMLSVISHLGTGLVRRALSLLHCLPVVSGNIGAFRADLVRELGGFRTDTVGEDLELTWRIYAAGYRVVFEPRAIVLAESPSTLGSLWKQRVRWARGLLQTMRIHRRMIGNPSYGIFGTFLVFNAVTMVVIPIAQFCIIGALLVLVPAGVVTVVSSNTAVMAAWELSGWLGLGLTIGMAVIGIALNSAWRDLLNLWTIPLWPLYATGIGLTMLAALIAELRGRPAHWNKLNRTGVVSHGEFASILGRER